jgi:GNAT superfamily N-acetyltransferase
MAAESIVNNKNKREYIRLAAESDICAIREIWRNIFTPDEDYLDVIFNNLYPLLDGFVYTNDEKILSVAFAIPITLIQRDVKYISAHKAISYNGRYLYGVATIEEARGRGLSRVLVKHIKDYYKSAGEDFIITRPAEESLFQFYKAQGFSFPLFRREITLNLRQLKQSAEDGALADTAITSKGYITDNEYFNTQVINLQEDIQAKDLYKLRSGLCKNLFECDSHILECILKLTNVEKGIFRYTPESGEYIIASYNTIQENNFKSLKELLAQILMNHYTMCGNNLNKHRTGFERIESITLIEPATGNFEKFPEKLDKCFIGSEITEFALCMPLSEKITKGSIENCFFNLTME